MYVYGNKSQERLDEGDKFLQLVFEQVLGFQLMDVTILEGHRTVERQNKLFLAGRSKIDGKTKLGNHNYKPSLAYDAAPYPVPKDGESTELYFKLAALVMWAASIIRTKHAKYRNYFIRWGGDWDGDGEFTDQTFDDLAHFEIVRR